MADLLPVADAQRRLLALAPARPAESVELREASGRWSAAPVTARRTQPEHPVSAMDGYAIRFADLPGPWEVVGESAAGRPFAGRVAARQAARIFTGALLPDGADTVLVQEEARREGDRLHLDGEGPALEGRNVRAAGLDFHAGDVLIAAGELLTPARIALAAVAGHASLPVRDRKSVV